MCVQSMIDLKRNATSCAPLLVQLYGSIHNCIFIIYDTVAAVTVLWQCATDGLV